MSLRSKGHRPDPPPDRQHQIVGAPPSLQTTVTCITSTYGSFQKAQIYNRLVFSVQLKMIFYSRYALVGKSDQAAGLCWPLLTCSLFMTTLTSPTPPTTTVALPQWGRKCILILHTIRSTYNSTVFCNFLPGNPRNKMCY